MPVTCMKMHSTTITTAAIFIFNEGYYYADVQSAWMFADSQLLWVL